MSEPNPENRSDQISEPTIQQTDQQSQQQIGKAVSASDSGISSESPTEKSTDQTDLKKNTDQPAIQSLEQNLQNSQETVKQPYNQSLESTLKQEIGAAPESSTEQSSQLGSGAFEQSPETQHPSESISFPRQATTTTSELTSSEQFHHSIASSTKWAPLIYGRTYAVDFRFLAVPHNFDEHSINYIWEFIKVTTRSAENLSSKPRWIFLRTKGRCIIGVTCLIRDLLHSYEDNVSEDLTRDRHGRPLYAFVGFVSETLVPSVIPAMNLALFADPYLELIPRKWHEIYAEVGNQQGVSQALKTNYYKQFRIEEGITADRTRPEILFEQLMPENQNAIVFWNIADVQNILFSASRSAQPIYLCTGNLTLRELLDSQFMSAALEEIQSRAEVQKVQKAPPSQSQTSRQSQPQQDSRSLESGRQGTYPHSREHPQHRGQEQQHSRDSGFERIRSLPKDLIVGLSKFARNNVESLFGENMTRDLDDAMFNTLGQLGKVFLGEAAVAEMYSQIANLDEFERRLIAAINATTVERNQLRLECEELRAQGRRYEAENIAQNIEKLNKKLAYAKSKLDEITHLFETQRSRASEEKSIEYSERTGAHQQRDPYFGFREKERPTDELPPESKDNISKSQDPWQL